MIVLLLVYRTAFGLLSVEILRGWKSVLFHERAGSSFIKPKLRYILHYHPNEIVAPDKTDDSPWSDSRNGEMRQQARSV
jgi:hypothetical protein